MNMSSRHTSRRSQGLQAVQSADKFVAHPDVKLHRRMRKKRKRCFPDGGGESRGDRGKARYSGNKFNDLRSRRCAMDIGSWPTRCATNFTSWHIWDSSLGLLDGLHSVQLANRSVARPNFSVRYLLSASYTENR